MIFKRRLFNSNKIGVTSHGPPPNASSSDAACKLYALAAYYRPLLVISPPILAKRLAFFKHSPYGFSCLPSDRIEVTVPHMIRKIAAVEFHTLTVHGSLGRLWGHVNGMHSQPWKLEISNCSVIHRKSNLKVMVYRRQVVP